MKANFNRKRLIRGFLDQLNPREQFRFPQLLFPESPLRGRRDDEVKPPRDDERTSRLGKNDTKTSRLGVDNTRMKPIK